MGVHNLEETDLAIDIENGVNGTCQQQGPEGSNFGNEHPEAPLGRNWGGFDQKMMAEEAADMQKNFSFLSGHREYAEDLADQRLSRDEKAVQWGKKMGSERPRKKGIEKSHKPPRYPGSLSLTAADQKLIQDISELSMLKRARKERLQEQKMKNSNPPFCNTNLCAMIITIIFCLIIIWQAF